MTWPSLARLLGPVSVEEFVAETWERAPRAFPQAIGREAADVLDLSELERLLASAHRAADGWLHLANGEKRPVPREMVDAEGMLDLAQVRAAFAAGNTLYLTKAERLSPSLMGLCRAVELGLTAAGVPLRQSVSAHVFLTPPDSQAFVAHRDEHASFVVQLEGTKEWVLYDLPPTARVPGAVHPDSLAGCPREVFPLEPGDVLYMPAWWVHEARTSAGHSLHVTVRAFPLRWSDILRDIADGHPDLSDAVPAHVAQESGRLVDELVERLSSVPSRHRMQGLVAAAARERRVPRVVLPDDGLNQVLAAGRIDMDTELEKCAGVHCEVAVDDDEATMRFPGGALRGPVALQAVFEFIAQAPALRPADLPDAPGGPYDRLVVARRMVEAGVLRVARSLSALDLNPA